MQRNVLRIAHYPNPKKPHTANLFPIKKGLPKELMKERKPKYPFFKLRVGEYFEVPCEKGETPTECVARVYGAWYHYKRTNTHLKLRIRILSNGSAVVREK